MNLIYGPNNEIGGEVFAFRNEHSYAAFIGVLSSIFMKAEISSKIRKKAYKASIIVDSKMMTPYKNQPESSFDRLVFILEKMIKPSLPVEISIFHSDDINISEESTVGLKHPTVYSWPIRKESSESSIITGNLPPKQLSMGNNANRYFKQFPVDVDYLLDYHTPIKVLYSTLNKSKVHLCYQGGTSWFSISMGIPTFIVHPKLDPQHMHFKTKLFGQDLNNISYFDGTKISNIRKHPCENHIHIKNLKQKLKGIT